MQIILHKRSQFLVLLSLIIIASCGRDGCGVIEGLKGQNHYISKVKVGDYLFGDEADDCVNYYSSKFDQIESLTDGTYNYLYKVESGDWWHLVKVDSTGLVLDALHRD